MALGSNSTAMRSSGGRAAAVVGSRSHGSQHSSGSRAKAPLGRGHEDDDEEADDLSHSGSLSSSSDEDDDDGKARHCRTGASIVAANDKNLFWCHLPVQGHALKVPTIHPNSHRWTSNRTSETSFNSSQSEFKFLSAVLHFPSTISAALTRALYPSPPPPLIASNRRIFSWRPNSSLLFQTTSRQLATLIPSSKSRGRTGYPQTLAWKCWTSQQPTNQVRSEAVA